MLFGGINMVNNVLKSNGYILNDELIYIFIDWCKIYN